MKHKIIGLAGQLGNGKDVVAAHLVKRLKTEENSWQRLGFADAVKKVFMNSFNVTWEFIEEWKRKTEVPPGFNIPIRRALQYIGDGFRQIQSDVWIQTALRNKFDMVISDCRYVNEAKMIKEHGGVVVLLWRPGFLNDDPNPSEAEIKPFVEWCVENCDTGPIKHYNACPSCGKWWNDLKYFDFFLRNDGDVDALYEKIDNILVPYLKKKYESESETI